jgi:hypothetical protein
MHDVGGEMRLTIDVTTCRAVVMAGSVLDKPRVTAAVRRENNVSKEVGRREGRKKRKNKERKKVDKRIREKGRKHCTSVQLYLRNYCSSFLPHEFKTRWKDERNEEINLYLQ